MSGVLAKDRSPTGYECWFCAEELETALTCWVQHHVPEDYIPVYGVAILTRVQQMRDEIDKGLADGRSPVDKQHRRQALNRALKLNREIAAEIGRAVLTLKLDPNHTKHIGELVLREHALLKQRKARMKG